MDEKIKPICDMYLAAALIAYGSDFDEIDRTDKNRYKFIFSKEVDYIWVLDQNNVIKMVNPTLDEVEAKFYSAHLIFPTNYPDALRRIKSAIHSL